MGTANSYAPASASGPSGPAFGCSSYPTTLVLLVLPHSKEQGDQHV